jgi:hypothetical protein
MYLATDQLPKDVKKHLVHKQKRNERFAQGVYGEIKTPTIEKDVIGLWEPPSYLSSRQAVRFRKSKIPTADYRCFYSSVLSEPVIHSGNRVNHACSILPWMGTRDHLVPIRRGIPGVIDQAHRSSSMVWTSNVVNTTIGLAPLPIRLKVREWLSTTSFDRNSLSIDSGSNLRWIVIDMLNEFRIKGRFPWSRNALGCYWYPSISIPLMDKWRKMEEEFLSLNEIDRDSYVKNFVWYF